jgi:hypothetical protein
MKTVVFLIIGFVFSFSINAQNTLKLKELPKIKIDTSLQPDTNNYLSVIPGYKPFYLPDYKFYSNTPENKFSEYTNKNNLITKRYLRYNHKMPVIGFGGSASKIPFVSPDSTLNYPIKELRIVIIDEDKEPGR